jgi:hypothetical protein
MQEEAIAILGARVLSAIKQPFCFFIVSISRAGDHNN